MFVTLRLLALWPWLAIRVRLPLVAAGMGALAAIGYTLLTGSQVPTIRSCVAALLVLAALAMGREAMTLRLVAAGAMVVLAVRPEALVGPSFQLSFAAIVAIVALHEHPRVRGWFEPREEARARRLLRGLGSLLLTGVVVEAALMPIAVYHFHKAGLYGAAANIVAIPLTTFVVMPLEAGALVLDTVGLGGPLWWLTDGALRGLLWLAHVVADAPGASLAVPSMPLGAFLSMIAGGLWLALWSTRVRWVGVLPIVVGAVWAALTPPPDLLVTGTGGIWRSGWGAGWRCYAIAPGTIRGRCSPKTAGPMASRGCSTICRRRGAAAMRAWRSCGTGEGRRSASWRPAAATNWHGGMWSRPAGGRTSW